MGIKFLVAWRHVILQTKGTPSGVPLFDAVVAWKVSLVAQRCVHSGRRMSSPPFSADSWARMPVQVMFALSTAFG